ncbi:MAG: hypothetical protein ACI4OL_03120 [Gemmiger sp.]
MPETWYKLDNAAKVFIATNNHGDPRVFRVSCTLADTQPEVDPALLRRALVRAARQFPAFQVTLHRGLFWYYLESTNKQPEPEPEIRQPCAEIYTDGGNDLLYRVSYYKRRINLEMFHVIADGNGGLAFLQAIVCCYLRECHPVELADVVPDYDASAAEQTKDAFRQFYGRRAARVVGGRQTKVVRLHGGYLPYDQTQFFELHLSAKAALAQAKACGVTLTSWLAAQLVLAIYQDTPSLERGRPIAISLPVNLRNYYPTATARNFFNTVKVNCRCAPDDTPATVAARFDAELKEQLSEERIKATMDGYEQLERNPAFKPVPLWIKNKAVSFFAWKANKNETATISNLGRIRPAEGLAPYIGGYTAYCSTRGLFTCVCSYGDDLCLGVASRQRSTSVLQQFARALAASCAGATLYATEVETE